MSSSRNKNSILMGVWFVTAIIAVIVIVTFFIKKDLAEKEKQAELYASIGGNSTHSSAGSSTNQGGTASQEVVTWFGDNVGKNDDGAAESNEDRDAADILNPDGENAEGGVEPNGAQDITPEPDKEPERGVVSTAGLDPTKPMVAFSFDDGPSVNTPRILETLSKYNAHATFFMVGENIAKYPEYIRAIRDAGCEPANHTINHANLKTLSRDEIIHEIEDNQKSINEALGANNSYLVRPPYGNYNDTVKEVCKHPMIMWTVDTLDWQSRNAQSVLEEVKRSVKDGYVILMHDLYQSTAEAVELVLPWLVEQGYQVCSVSEMYAARGETLKDGHAYRYTYTAEEYISRQSQ